MPYRTVAAAALAAWRDADKCLAECEPDSPEWHAAPIDAEPNVSRRLIRGPIIWRVRAPADARTRHVQGCLKGAPARLHS